MKILFLDFDGVITTPESRWKIDPEKVRLIVRILDETGAKIVVTSSWKLGYRDIEPFKDELRKKCPEGIEPLIDNIIGVTDSGGSWRGDEVERWLETHGTDSYVILDDDSDFHEDQLFRFVQTDTMEGVTEREVKLCVSVLNGEKIANPIRLNLELTTMWRNKCGGIVGDATIDRLLQEYHNSFKEMENNKTPEPNKFHIGETVRLKDGDGRPHLIREVIWKLPMKTYQHGWFEYSFADGGIQQEYNLEYYIDERMVVQTLDWLREHKNEYITASGKKVSDTLLKDIEEVMRKKAP